MNKKLYLGTWFGVPLYAHWSMIILYVLFVPTYEFWTAPFWHAVSVMTMLYVSVVIHEYAHAIEASTLGYDTNHIYLHVIGGTANIEDIPAGSWDEFWISAAGPASNLVLVALFMFFLPSRVFETMGGSTLIYSPFTMEFWAIFAILNFIFCVFNLLPVYPLDGGRIFRALVAQMFGLKNATKLASILGGVMGLALSVFGGLQFDILILFIGVFIVFASFGEYSRIVSENDL